MRAEIDIERAPGRMRKRVLGVLFFTVVFATVATFFGAQHYFERLERETASNHMVLYQRALNETLRQHQHLPFVLANDPRYAQALHPIASKSEINDRLELLAQEAKLEAIYLMDASGRVLATSNARQPHSFLGQNYGFRPYFQDALQGQRSDYFAIGATSGRPGYFVAEPVSFTSSTQKGVIAIKLDVSELQRSWESDTETVVAINEDNIVVLASNPDWLYRPVSVLEPEVRNAILESRQFGAEQLVPLDWSSFDESRVTVEGTNYLLASGVSEWRNWTVHYLQPESIILRETLLTTAFFGSIITFLLGFATFLRSRRIELAYTASERQRTELIETNRRLEQAQTELARSAKLAALGHLAASVTHELGQPISAFRNHLVAAEIGNEITSPQTATNLNKLVDRMEAITGQFKFFARGRGDQKTNVDLSIVLQEVEDLLKTEIVAGNIDFHPAILPVAIELHAHQIQLEQALINLLKNAIHAVENEPHPKIKIDVVKGLATVEIHVTDNGPGLTDTALIDLQEPFFTTKPSGVGMGLGLAIATEIINDHGGELTLGEANKGANFIVTLPYETEGKAT
ncbi:MAG: two-component system C4-dicarboxylate transport sensor histidine kinase DctB [Ascidiaceihabitans sp.]|jgi:two-component system C4-dicarboxylate transport sensor histidine kinase DctB